MSRCSTSLHSKNLSCAQLNINYHLVGEGKVKMKLNEGEWIGRGKMSVNFSGS